MANFNFADVPLPEDNVPWTVHDGAFFTENVLRNQRARAPTERRLVGEHPELRAEQLASQLEAERARSVRLEAGLQRAEERLADEQVRAAVAEERWQPLLRQRDDAQRERQRAARALSAMHAEKNKDDTRSVGTLFPRPGNYVQPRGDLAAAISGAASECGLKAVNVSAPLIPRMTMAQMYKFDAMLMSRIEKEPKTIFFITRMRGSCGARPPYGGGSEVGSCMYSHVSAW